ncbi:MAG: PadR family transcriptional regulator [Acidobacteria bacterium]|nr:PadR family transcriptional regulator [Acidobacteriota bacterium]
MSDLKKGSAEIVILSLLDEAPLHGYGIAKLVTERTDGALKFHAASLYPVLYRLEKRGVIRGEWEAGKGDRRRRHYRLTPKGKRTLETQRGQVAEFIDALGRLTGVPDA